MSDKAKRIMERYEKSYVTDTQLKRYLELGAIKQEEYDEIFATKHPNSEVSE